MWSTFSIQNMFWLFFLMYLKWSLNFSSLWKKLGNLLPFSFNVLLDLVHRAPFMIKWLVFFILFFHKHSFKTSIAKSQNPKFNQLCILSRCQDHTNQHPTWQVSLWDSVAYSWTIWPYSWHTYFPSFSYVIVASN